MHELLPSVTSMALLVNPAVPVLGAPVSRSSQAADLERLDHNRSEHNQASLTTASASAGSPSFGYLPLWPRQIPALH
jgi:hypothetical protein